MIIDRLFFPSVVLFPFLLHRLMWIQLNKQKITDLTATIMEAPLQDGALDIYSSIF